MGQNEKLGIDIEINLGKAKEQIDRLNDLIAKLGQSPEAAAAKFETLTKRIEALGKATGMGPEKVKSLMKAFEDSSSFDKFFKNLGKFGTETEKVLNAEKAMIRQRNKDLETAGNERMVLIRRQTQQELDERKRAIQQLQAAGSNQQLNWNAQAGTQGVKYQGVDGGFVKSSVQTQNLNPDTFARIQAEAVKMNSALKEAPKHVDGLNLALGKLTTRIAEFYSIRTVLFAVTNQIRDAISGALDFDQSIRDIAAVSGATDKEMAMMGDSILNIATHSKYTAKEVGNLLQILAQAGVAAKDMPTVSSVVGMFATGTNATPQQAADVFTTSMNVWDIQAEDSIRIANTLTAALNASKLEVGGLSTAFNYLASQASTFGYSLEETAGIIAAMSQAGVKASTIGTGVSQLLKDLAAPKDRFKDLLNQYGISLDAVNPKIHSFAEIVQVFTDKNVAVEDILARMDTRVGRSLVAAMKVGAGSFRDMTDAVTGSEAAIVAYSKSMEGARAKMNVLKQSFLATVVSMGESLSGVFGPLISTITTVVNGLGTLPGQIILFAGALRILVPAVNSLTVSMLANPLFGTYAAIALTITAVIAALGYFGDKTSETAEIFKDYNDKVLKNVEAYQQVSKAVKESRREAEGNNKELKKAGELYDKLGEKTQLSNTVLETKVKLTDATKNALYELQKQYPQHFQNIDIENLKYGEQLEIIRNINRERKVKDISNVNAMNKLDQSIADKQKRLQELELRAQDEPTFFGPGYINTKNEMDQIKKDMAAETQELQRTSQLTSAGSWYYKNGQRHFNDGTPKEERPGKEGKLGPKGKKERGPTPNSDYINGKSFEAYYEEQNNKYAEDRLKSDRAANEIILRDKNRTEKERNDALLAIVKINQQIYEKEVEAETNKIQDQLLKSKPTSSLEVGRNKILAGNLIKDAEAAAAERRKTSDDAARKSGDTIGAPILDAAKREKQLDLELRAVQQTASLKKEETYIASDIYKIEEETLTKTIEIGAQKVKNLETENDSIEAWIEQNKTNEAAKQKIEEYGRTLEQNKDRIQDQNLLLEAQRKQYDRLADHSYWGNFKRGAGGAFASISDTDKLSQGLGSDLTNQAFNGITGTLSNTLSTFTMPDSDAIDSIKSKINDLNIQKAEIQAEINSITSKGDFMTGADKTKLNEQAAGLAAVNSELSAQEKLLEKQQNAWSRFKDGLKEIMQQILKTLQEYIIKLMVVKMAQSVFGAVSGGPSDSMADSGWGTWADGSSANGMANGGLVPLNMGVPGKDSVPAMLTPGEYVLPVNLTRKLGVGYLDGLRRQQFAEGGLVGGNSRPTTSSSEGKTVQNLQIVNIVDPSQIPQTTDDQIINVISYDMARKGQTYRAVRQVAAG